MSKKNEILVVGLGASAGGLDPLKKFFNSLPGKTGMAFIVVQHLSPDKESSLREILQRETELNVLQVKEKTEIREDRIYVIPPNKLLSIENHHLELSAPQKKHGSASIDLLFRTLAKRKQKYAAGIIFSGTGSDGITGIKIIKEHGGITIAQDPDEAQHPSMPANAINTGAVDKILPVKEMAEVLMQYRESLSYVRIPEDDEELRASNEELQSMNEELQSTSKELETSKEELPSVNEELKTINDQLEGKVDELSRAHNDLENLMEATEIGIIFIDRELCVRRFTSASTEIFNLISSDKGRPLQHITHTLDYDSLVPDITKVLDNLEKMKKMVASKDGRWFIMRMRPYRSSENKIEGVVLSFTEFTELKEAREIIREQNFQETLATLGVYVLEQENLDTVMHRAIQQSCAILNLKCAAIIIYNEDNNTFRIASEAGCGCRQTELEYNKKWDLGYSLNSKKPVTVQDYKNEKRFSVSPFMAKKEFISSVHISIRGSESAFGVFALYSQEKREFSKQEMHFIQVVANILGRTIEQKRAQAELQEANTRLQNEMNRSEQFQREIINNSVLERWELGGYLHDTLGQLLASVKILVDDILLKLSGSTIDVTGEANEINRIMDMCIRGIRDVIHNIIPVDIEKEGVAQAFRLLMSHTFKLYDVNCILESNEILEEIKNREAATHLYHIVQEAFKNAAVHGKADTILVSIDKKDNLFILRIKDDGIGLKAHRTGKGKGIRIMKHRMDLLGGTFTIENYSDENESGVIITCTLPVKYLKRDHGEK